MERKLGGKRIKERESEKRKLGKNICSMYLSLSVSLCLSLFLSVSLFLSPSHTNIYTVHTQKLGSVDNVESNKEIVVNVFIHLLLLYNESEFQIKNYPFNFHTIGN
jgi:hypothetical protein